MSFGFSIGDFATVINHANTVRKNFVGAPAQFKALSDEYDVSAPLGAKKSFVIHSSTESEISLSS
jgi:hypothetical protein